MAISLSELIHQIFIECLLGTSLNKILWAKSVPVNKVNDCQDIYLRFPLYLIFQNHVPFNIF